jgi:hypothetical protein
MGALLVLRFRSSFLRSSSEAVGLRGALRFLSMEARHSGGLCDLAIRSGVSTENTCFLKEPSSTNTMCEGRLLSGPVPPCVVNSTCYTCQREGGVGHHHAEERPNSLDQGTTLRDLDANLVTWTCHDQVPNRGAWKFVRASLPTAQTSMADSRQLFWKSALELSAKSAYVISTHCT